MKRGIAGNLVFVSFNRDALLVELGTEKKISKFKANDIYSETGAAQFISIEDWDKQMSNFANGGGNQGAGIVGKPSDLVSDEVTPHYADELLPFDITITFDYRSFCQ